MKNEDRPPSDSEFDFRGELLKAHINDYESGFNEDHIMGKFDNDAMYHIETEITARLFKNQILKCLELCRSKEEAQIVLNNADRSYKYLFDKLVNMARVCRNKENNYLIKEILGNAQKEEEKNKAIGETILKLGGKKDGRTETEQI